MLSVESDEDVLRTADGGMVCCVDCYKVDWWIEGDDWVE
jgi:hypothetical protein